MSNKLQAFEQILTIGILLFQFQSDLIINLIKAHEVSAFVDVRFVDGHQHVNNPDDLMFCSDLSKH
jgi:hypothetical protein